MSQCKQDFINQGFNVEKKVQFHISRSQKTPFRKLWKSIMLAAVVFSDFPYFRFHFLVLLFFSPFVCFFFLLRITLLVILKRWLTPPH